MRSPSLAAGFVALALMGSEAAAQTANQFDLVCSGTRQTGLNADPVPHDYRIRVDLGAGRWCWDSCERTYPFVEVGPDRIVFAKEDIETDRRRSTMENAVSRQTGEHRLIWIESRPLPNYVETLGRCDPSDFSGFPSARF